MPTTTTLPRGACDEDASIMAVMLHRRRHLVVTLRWRGLADHNVVALFPTLHDASVAARRLAARPECVSALVLVPIDPASRCSVAVGVHTPRREVADEATVSFRRSGGRCVSRFAREDTFAESAPGVPDPPPRSDEPGAA